MDNTQFYHRVFFAITVPDDVACATAGIYHQLHHEQGYEQLSWIKPNLQHITVQYLGGVKGGSLIALAEEIAPTLLALDSFSLGLGPLRLFPNLRKAHCLILRVNLTEQLQAVVDCIRNGVAARHIQTDDKPFRPHLTMARIPPKVRRLRRPELELPDIQLPVREISLMNSFQEGNGVQYQTIARFALKATQTIPDVEPMMCE